MPPATETKRGPGRPATGKTPKRQLGTVPDDLWDLYERAAKKAGHKNKADWMRAVLTAEARKVMRK